jgi:hypothetical protein
MNMQHTNLLDRLLIIDGIENPASENNHLFLIVSGVLEK